MMGFFSGFSCFSKRCRHETVAKGVSDDEASVYNVLTLALNVPSTSSILNAGALVLY